jgi:hypothetical protein
MARIWPKGVRQISGIRPPQSSSADWQSAVSPAGSRLGGQTCQPRCHPAETLEKSALGIILSHGAKNVLIRAIRAIRGQPDLFPRGAGVLAHRLPHRPCACLFLPSAQRPAPKASQFVRLALCLRASVVAIREINAASSRLCAFALNPDTIVTARQTPSCPIDVRGNIPHFPLFAGRFHNWFAVRCPFSPRHESVH